MFPFHFFRPQVVIRFCTATILPPKLVRLYSPSLRSAWPRCTPSAVSPPRSPVSAGSWWICGSTRLPSPHPSGHRAPVNLLAAVLAVATRTGHHAPYHEPRTRAHTLVSRCRTRARRRGLSKWAETSGCDYQIKARFPDRTEMTIERAFDLLWKRTFFPSSWSTWRVNFFPPVLNLNYFFYK